MVKHRNYRNAGEVKNELHTKKDRCKLAKHSILFSAMPIFYWFLIFFIGNIFYFKNIEEKDLIKRFGEDYTNYRDKVSMFIPSLTPYNK